jgi:hypothetical protein
MKKVIIGIIIIILLGVIGLGVWGYLKAQEVKKQNKEIQQITADTLVLEKINQNDTEIALSGWKKLAEKATSTGNDLDNIASAPSSLRESVSQFYGAQAQDKYEEAQYLQFLIDGQQKMDLKSTQPKSKGQIETVLSEFNKLQNNINQNSLSLGPEFNTQMKKAEQEAETFVASLNNLISKMNSESPATQISSAGLDKAADDLKQAIIESLNKHVDLQDKIKKEISDLSNINWVNPFLRFDKDN